MTFLKTMNVYNHSGMQHHLVFSMQLLPLKKLLVLILCKSFDLTPRVNSIIVLSSQYGAILKGGETKKSAKNCALFKLGSAERNRTFILGSGNPHTIHCTTAPNLACKYKGNLPFPKSLSRFYAGGMAGALALIFSA